MTREAAARILPLLRDGPRRAQELADELSIDASAVRRHLDTLRADGLVADDDEVRGRGRPKKRWRLTNEGAETFRRDYALLLGALMDKIADTDGRGKLMTLLAAVADDLARTLPDEPEPRRRLAHALKLYNDLGFEAHLEGGGDAASATLVQRNCILLRTARARPEAMCDCFDQGILRAAFPGARIRLATCMATGDARCRHEIEWS